MGRPRKPDALKAVQGNPGKRKLVEKPGAATAGETDGQAVDAATVSPIGPATAEAPTANPVRTPKLTGSPLQLEGHAKKIWDLLASDLSRMSFVRHQDAHAFARYCQYLALWIQLSAKVNPDTIVKTTSSAHVEMDRLDKNFQAMLILEKRLIDLEDRFGLNPRGRQMMVAQLAGFGGSHPGADLFGNEQDKGPQPATTGQPQQEPAAKPTRAAGFLMN